MSRISLWLLLCLIHSAVIGQFIPGGISYQAVARESGGIEIINQNLTVRIGILRDEPTGTLVYEEVHDVVTNGFGLFALEIGSGVSTGNAAFDELVEVSFGAGRHYMRVDIDTPQSPGFEFLGTTELLAVPYAYHAATADSAPEVDGDPTNELISTVTLVGNTLNINEAGVSHQVNLSGLVGSGGNSALISEVQLNGMSLQIVQNGTTHSVDLTSVGGTSWQAEAPGAVYTSQRVGIAQQQPLSSLHVNGSYGAAVQVFSPSGGSSPVAFLLSDSDQVAVVNTGAGAAEIVLPLSTSCEGRVYQLRRFFANPGGAFPMSVLVTPGDTLDGLTQRVFNAPAQEYISLIATSQGWFVLNHSIAD